MIRNVVFDMGQVLIHWTPKTLISCLDVAAEDVPILEREVFVSLEWTRLDRGSMTCREAFESICRRLPERLHEPARRMICGWWEFCLKPMEGMAELVGELKENGYHIYLLSNANTHLPEYFSRIPGSEHFEGLMVSALELLLKPQHEIYERLCERFGLVPEECFFVDDSPANVEGAIRCGLKSAIFHGDVERLKKDLRAEGVTI